MISGRTVTIIGISIVILCAGLFFYAEQRNQKFAESLPTLQPQKVAVDAVVNKTPAPLTDTTPNRQPSQTDERFVESPVFDTPIAPVAADSTDYSQTEINTVFDDAFAFFDDFSVFDTIDLEATRAKLEELLRALHGNDPRVSEFLGYWDISSRIFALRAEYRTTGANDAALREQIFALEPQAVLPKVFELGTDLIQPGDTVVNQRGQWLEDWLVLAEKAEAAHYATELAKEAFDNGEINAQEAEGFIEDVSGLDVKVREVEVTDE
ncbi:hypothetical protein F4009_09670 [Candidatus Poribacteria bacterium]|nr:hypothetical protein [Candidatus Poribacteria bacterium]MYH84002.1 hypothetical protein [Candidatus Poribacteria bacterium]MYK94243.1 hypothetical protein [Candidatus Poribacteria bacterium]